MQVSLLKTILASGCAILIIACNNNTDKKKDTPKKDTTTTEAVAVTPAPAKSACYSNDGLTYKTVITISFDSITVTGNVTSEELESGKKETVQFDGIRTNDKISVTFKGTAPVIGKASEWTDKPWRIKFADGNDKLVLIFNSKNYETNEWQDIQSEFTPCNK